MSSRSRLGPEVTVVIPTRDRWALLRDALDSALAQEGVELEVIVVDDSSFWTIPEDELSDGDPRVQLLRLERGAGVARARNLAIERARAPWVAFLDDDDLWAPEKLRLQLEVARSDDVALVYTGAVHIDRDGHMLELRRTPDLNELPRGLFETNLIGGPSTVIARTELVRRVGCFDEQVSVLADWDLWIRLLQVGRAAVRPEVLAAYRVHTENMHLSGISGVRGELGYLRHKHRELCAELGVKLGGIQFERWMVARQRESGKQLATAYAYFLLGLHSGRPREFARAVGMLFGESAMRLGGRLQPATLSAVPATEPGWLVERRERARTRPLETGEGNLEASVIVPVRNGSAFLERLLPALEAQSLERSRFEIIVADDGSTDGVEDLVRESDLLRLSSGPPRNAFAARNRAARLARAPAIAFCDVDCLPNPTWLEAGLAALDDADLVAGAVRFDLPDRRTIWTLLDMDTTKDQETCVRAGNAETANLFVRRDVFERVGGFDPSLPEHGDFDFAKRCVAAGARLVYGAEAIARHPTRNRARPFLRMMWEMNRWYAVRESRAGRKPIALKLREWIPIVYAIRARRRWGRSLGLDRRWLAENGVRPTAREQLQALPLLYILLPYERCIGQLSGWWQGRRFRRRPPSGGESPI